MTFEEIKEHLSSPDPVENLRRIGAAFGSAARFSTSLGLEDQVITHWIGSNKLPIEIFTLDTGRLFQETLDTLEMTRTRYKIPVKVYFPDASEVEQMVYEKGPNSFFESVENRKECCRIRKVVPLKRALAGAKVWITGLRADQSNNRQSMQAVEWDPGHQVVKYNPLLDWSIGQVETFIKENRVPVNALHKKGFPSIGCAPCTRAIAPDEDLRAGRWWWESSAKECGLHEDTKVKEVKDHPTSFH